MLPDSRFGNPLPLSPPPSPCMSSFDVKWERDPAQGGKVALYRSSDYNHAPLPTSHSAGPQQVRNKSTAGASLDLLQLNDSMSSEGFVYNSASSHSQLPRYELELDTSEHGQDSSAIFMHRHSQAQPAIRVKTESTHIVSSSELATPRSTNLKERLEPSTEKLFEEFTTNSEGEEEDSSVESTSVRSATNRMVEKRKMKRFRYIGYHRKTDVANNRSLTHSQTRFLMSEFSRQAHPDAAHRERLSRVIPGLSPRQVQIWFQNR